MSLRNFLKEHGQTAVEYLLMLAVSAGLGMTFFKKFNAYMFDDPNSYFSVQLRFYQAQFDPNTGYKKYRLPR